MKFSDETKRAVKRLVRVAVAGAIASVIAHLADNPNLILLTPILNGIGKYIRDKYNIQIMV